jgi:hypothetical protein
MTGININEIKVPPWVSAQDAEAWKYGVVCGWCRGFNDAVKHYGIPQEDDDEPEDDAP